ncbi:MULTISPECIES: ornithine cyclodeaminase family protein [Streptomyces]|nr:MULTISPECIES: ornithine cyclodeaminase family protein [Streptomyces]MYT10363.1 ornithine cyclodeaminase family protein [Streptomyces sp. SID5470]
MTSAGPHPGPPPAARSLPLVDEDLALEAARALVDEDPALEAVRAAFAATVDGPAFPSLAVHGSDPRNRFTLKPSASATHAGVKIGTYWSRNTAHGLPRHHFTPLLLDQTTGRLAAVLEDATTLAVFGTGHQAAHEVRAVSRVRAVGAVLVVGRTAGRAERTAAVLAARGHEARVTGAEEACARADVITTATTARSDTPPLFDASWIRPGTHLSCMGADAPGKRELPPELFARARVFCDLPEQARRMGESRHALADTVLTPLGDVLTGRAEGRIAGSDITVFDGSGIGVRDLCPGLALLEKMDISL